VVGLAQLVERQIVVLEVVGSIPTSHPTLLSQRPPRYTETMTIDERLEKLTERHEALTQSVELMIAEGRETSSRISGLERLAQQDGENIRALARIAEIHERRLTGVEGGE
jgi:hypothetical protein